jgi:hypothetical protein
VPKAVSGPERDETHPRSKPKWRNWQTRQLQEQDGFFAKKVKFIDSRFCNVRVYVNMA